MREERETRKRVRQVAPTDNPQTAGLPHDMDDLREIVELRADPVADLQEFLEPVPVRVHAAADT
jgi:hypothetical protein